MGSNVCRSVCGKVYQLHLDLTIPGAYVSALVVLVDPTIKKNLPSQGCFLFEYQISCKATTSGSIKGVCYLPVLGKGNFIAHS